ncbi:uncharacterized protein LOC119562736 isoform X2 [Drosophila subpulchrella]|uniref:uncharacterized protein LOC119562736 isoform X2 n=1 Tax=Drosophila subpulchrella TaxID=1486046 RepID=UPI0018A13672|nr:uncharacterized protein LOC119562736 isoform X2 [Drosophila subpulchrella]XP_037731868.1 uncharacterized protein LOC119562736 isoform X2 [Drosophila subpulchrella]XP_037731869.1 uncharacterized protein LOC119562736 isoform X2 [Drosophila subpulchrella]
MSPTAPWTGYRSLPWDCLHVPSSSRYRSKNLTYLQNCFSFPGAETSSETSITSMSSKHRNHRWFVTTIDVFTNNSALGKKKLISS